MANQHQTSNLTQKVGVAAKANFAKNVSLRRWQSNDKPNVTGKKSDHKKNKTKHVNDRLQFQLPENFSKITFLPHTF